MKLERGLSGLMAWVCVLLVACGGGGGGGPTGGGSGGTPVVPSPAPAVPSTVTPPTVVEASAAGSTSINLVWTPALSSTAAAGLRYDVHVSEQTGFTPLPITLKFSGNDVFEARIAGLRAGTTYHLQVLASDPQQAQAASTAVTVATAATPGELRAGVRFKALDDAAVSSVEPARVIIAVGVVVPRVGSYIASAQGSGFLRRVTATTTLPDGRTALATAPAALADVVSAGDLSSTMSFPAPLANSAGLPGPRMRVLAAGSGRANTVERQWADARVTLATRAAADPTNFSFEGTLQLSNTVNVSFEPRLQADFTLGLTGVAHAKAVLLGSASLRQQIVVQAAASAVLERTVQVIAPRTIVAVHFIGPVPVVYSGQFSADLKMEAQADAAVRGSITTTLNLNEIELGMEYSGGQWTTLKRATPTHSFEIRGDGDATLRVQTTLIPKLQLSLYGAVTVQVAATPRLSAGLGVHGESSALAGAASSRWTADYWLTEGSLSTAMDAHVMADLQILQPFFEVWPAGARADNLETYHRLEVVPQTPIAGLPILAAAADYVARHPNYPDAVRILRTYSEVPNPLFPLGPAVFLGFGAWTDVVVPAPLLEDAYVIRPNPVGAGADDLWLEFAKPGTHRVRLGAHSTLGTAARQVVEIEVVSKQYVVWSNLSVVTNVQRISAGSSTTHTVAISGRVEGPKGTLMAVSPYFSFLSGGSFVGLPVVRNCGAWTQLPVIPDRDNGVLACTRGENDPEETTFTLNGFNWVRASGGTVQTSTDQVNFFATCDSELIAQRSCPVLGNIHNDAVVARAITLLW